MPCVQLLGLLATLGIAGNILFKFFVTINRPTTDFIRRLRTRRHCCIANWQSPWCGSVAFILLVSLSQFLLFRQM